MLSARNIYYSLTFAASSPLPSYRVVAENVLTSLAEPHSYRSIPMAFPSILPRDRPTGSLGVSAQRKFPFLALKHLRYCFKKE